LIYVLLYFFVGALFSFFMVFLYDNLLPQSEKDDLKMAEKDITKAIIGTTIAWPYYLYIFLLTSLSKEKSQ